MFYYKVKLNEPVPPEEMERILVEAAREMGYRTKVYDRTMAHYEIAPVERVEEYAGTRVKLSRFIFPVLEVEFDKRDLVDSLYVEYTGIGFGGRGTVERYISAVSEKLESASRDAKPRLLLLYKVFRPESKEES